MDNFADTLYKIRTRNGKFVSQTKLSQSFRATLKPIFR